MFRIGHGYDVHAFADNRKCIIGGVDIPLLDVINFYRQNSGHLSVINNLTLSIPAIDISNEYGIDPPTQLLMVLKKDKDKFNHPTIKPVEFVKRHLLHTTQPNDIVLDCFMGSGTTCVAAKDIGRHYIGFEIDEKWFRVAQDRLNNIDANGQTSMFLV